MSPGLGWFSWESGTYRVFAPSGLAMPSILQKQHGKQALCPLMHISAVTAGISPKARSRYAHCRNRSCLWISKDFTPIASSNNSEINGERNESISQGFLGPGMTPNDRILQRSVWCFGLRFRMKIIIGQHVWFQRFRKGPNPSVAKASAISQRSEKYL